MFDFFRKNKSVDHTEVFKQDQIALLQQFQGMMTSYRDIHHQEVARKVAECLKDIDKESISMLKIALTIKWLIREIGAMLYDHLFELTDEENEIWQEIKEVNGRHDSIGHGFGV